MKLLLISFITLFGVLNSAIADGGQFDSAKAGATMCDHPRGKNLKLDSVSNSGSETVRETQDQAKSVDK